MSEELFHCRNYRASLHSLAAAFHITEERRNVEVLDEILKIARSRAEALRDNASIPNVGQTATADFVALAIHIEESATQIRFEEPADLPQARRLSKVAGVGVNVVLSRVVERVS